ncbi:phosphotransferase [Kitasatospora sp. NPDC051914]|uniref:phosphotransferase n=1 Tax=Kitasatospora sp. NPDC051914 TaxID=3154945 RepID=UPI0034457290
MADLMVGGGGAGAPRGLVAGDALGGFLTAVADRLGGAPVRFDRLPTGPLRGVCGRLTLDDGRAVHVTAAGWNSPGITELRREVLISDRIAAVGPALLCAVREVESCVLVHELVSGRSVSLVPGSPDLAPVGDFLLRSAKALAGDPVGQVGVLGDALRFWPSWERFAGSAWSRAVLDPREARVLQRLTALDGRAQRLGGPAVVHGSLHPGNLLITPDGGVTAVGWRRARFGPAWADAALLVPHLVEAGRDPAGAEAWARQYAGLDQADEDDLTALAVALAGRVWWRDHGPTNPYGFPWRVGRDAALRWMRFRLACHS